MNSGIEILIVFLLILLNGFFALSEFALVSVNRARLAVLERRGMKGAAQARLLSEDPQRFLPPMQVGMTGVSVLSGAFGGARLSGQLEPVLAGIPPVTAYAEPLSLAIVVILMTYVTLVIGELVPKRIALRYPEALSAAVARPLMLLALITRPAVWLLGASTNLVLRIFGLSGAPDNSVTEEELKIMLAEGEESGVIETEERDMIERVLRLADKPVRAIMTPRTELSWIDRTDTAEEIAASLRDAPHSRFVVCDGSIDNVVGVVLAKDLLDHVLRGESLSIAASLRQAVVMPDTVTALDALDRLKSDPIGIALVMDEYGSFEGMVTAADVLEAIVGDTTVIEEAAREGAALHDGVYNLEGMNPVDDLKARLELPDLPAEGSYHTLAGLMLALLRRVPREGDRIAFGGWLFEVIEMEGRRVTKVRATKDAAD